MDADLFRQAEATEKNRRDRMCYLRTAGIICAELQRVDETLAFAEQMNLLAQEDPEWEGCLEALTEASSLQIRANHQLQRPQEVRQIGITTAKLLKAYDPPAPGTKLSKDLWAHHHNLGAQLYFAGQYDLAIPQFRRVLALSGGTAHTHLWLAASLWARTKDRDEVHLETMVV